MRLVSAFPSVDAEVASEVCPLFFRLGQPDTLAVRARCLETIDPWRNGQGYRIPAEFVVIKARAPVRHSEGFSYGSMMSVSDHVARPRRAIWGTI